MKEKLVTLDNYLFMNIIFYISNVYFMIERFYSLVVITFNILFCLLFLRTTPQACSFELISCINKGCMYVCMYHMIATQIFDIHCKKWFHFCCHPPLIFEHQFSKTPTDTLLLCQFS